MDLRTRKEFYLDEKKINPEIVVSVSSDNFISKDKKFVPLVQSQIKKQYHAMRADSLKNILAIGTVLIILIKCGINKR